MIFSFCFQSRRRQTMVLGRLTEPVVAFALLTTRWARSISGSSSREPHISSSTSCSWDEHGFKSLISFWENSRLAFNSPVSFSEIYIHCGKLFCCAQSPSCLTILPVKFLASTLEPHQGQVLSSWTFFLTELVCFAGWLKSMPGYPPQRVAPSAVITTQHPCCVFWFHPIYCSKT